MYKNEHIKITAEKFGGMENAMEYAWVHDWLDEIAKTGININKHRQYRHHEKALEDQFVPFIEKFHPEANLNLALSIARQHIMDDLGAIPRDELDFF